MIWCFFIITRGSHEPVSLSGEEDLLNYIL